MADTISFEDFTKGEDFNLKKYPELVDYPASLACKIQTMFEKQEQVEKFVSDFRRKHGSILIGYEMKRKGQDKQLGYFGSHHLDILIDGLITELQVMTRKMWKYKESAHALYTANRDEITRGGSASRADSALSKKIYALANQPKFQRQVQDSWKHPHYCLRFPPSRSHAARNTCRQSLGHRSSAS